MGCLCGQLICFLLFFKKNVVVLRKNLSFLFRFIFILYLCTEIYTYICLGSMFCV